MYIHLNPVRIKKLGLGKDDRQREKEGILPVEPSEEQVFKRVETLRKHRWSSIRRMPDMLRCPIGFIARICGDVAAIKEKIRKRNTGSGLRIISDRG